MVLPAEGGGGGSVIERLDPLFTEIVDLLGQLAGNEAAWRVFDSEQNRTLSDGWMLEPGYFTIPGDYGFDTPALFVAMHPMHPDFNSSEVNNAQREQLLQDAVNQVWNEARDQWSGGAVSTVYRSASRNVWEPDPGAMNGARGSLDDLTVWMHEQQGPEAGWTVGGESHAPHWLSNLAVHWPATSQGASSFQAFWTDVNEKLALYLHAAARLATTATQVTATISDFQTNLLRATERCRDRLREALQQWQVWKDDSGAWPTGAMIDNSGTKDILGHISYWTGVVAAVPTPASGVAGGVSLVTGTMDYFMPDESIEMEALSALKASDVHNGFLNDLKTIETNMGTVLDNLQTRAPGDDSPTGSQAFNSYVGDAMGNRSDWTPPSVNL